MKIENDVEIALKGEKWSHFVAGKAKKWTSQVEKGSNWRPQS